MNINTKYKFNMKGWFNESWRHMLAAKGIKSTFKKRAYMAEKPHKLELVEADILRQWVKLDKIRKYGPLQIPGTEFVVPNDAEGRKVAEQYKKWKEETEHKSKHFMSAKENDWSEKGYEEKRGGGGGLKGSRIKQRRMAAETNEAERAKDRAYWHLVKEKAGDDKELIKKADLKLSQLGNPELKEKLLHTKPISEQDMARDEKLVGGAFLPLPPKDFKPVVVPVKKGSSEQHAKSLGVGTIRTKIKTEPVSKGIWVETPEEKAKRLKEKVKYLYSDE
jgi:hypothetical protein